MGGRAARTITILYEEQHTQLMTDTWVDTYTMNIDNNSVIILLPLPALNHLHLMQLLSTYYNIKGDDDTVDTYFIYMY